VNANDIVVPLISGVFGLGSGGALIAWWRERRVDKAKSQVAEQTVDMEVDNKRLALLERQMQALSDSHNKQMQALADSFDRERQSLYSTIDHLRADLEEEQAESAKKDEKISRLTTQVNEIQDALDQVKAELAGKPPKPENGT
jgi:predicted RNase H-like nuclease (RuvC/YqgF family)